MAGRSAEKELLILFDEMKKAADLAVSGGTSDEARCLDALRLLREFPISMSLLISTQVGKKLRALTKHPKAKIQSKASELIEQWKNVVRVETEKNNKKQSTTTDSSSSSVETKSHTADAVKTENRSSQKIPIKTENRNSDKISLKTNTVKSETILKSESIKADKLHHNENQESVKKEEKKAVGNKKTASSSIVPPKLPSMVKCNDPLRDKFREILAEAFSKVASESDDDFVDQVNSCDPIRMAVTVESVMFEKLGRSNGAHKFKYRSIMFNLKDANNPDLRRKVLLGEVTAERLVSMTPEEMASDQRKQENKQIKDKALFDCERGGPPKATTDQFKCGRCGQRKTTYYQLQTRSADEPMTTFVTCVNCNNHWKFC